MSLSKLQAFDVKFISKQYLDVESKMILMVLLSMRNLSEVFISNKQLAGQCSISVATLKRRLQELEAEGFIDRSTRGEGNGAGRTKTTKINEQKIIELIVESSPKQTLRFAYTLPSKIFEYFSVPVDKNDHDIFKDLENPFH